MRELSYRPNSPGVQHSVASNKLRQRPATPGQLHMEWRSPPGRCVTVSAVHSMRDGMGGMQSSSSCRRLQEANLQSRKTLLDCCRTSGTNRRTDRPDRNRRAHPPAPSWPTPSGPPGVNPRGLAGLCQPSLPPGHLLGVSTPALPALPVLVPAFLRPSKTGRQGGVTPGGAGTVFVVVLPPTSTGGRQ